MHFYRRMVTYTNSIRSMVNLMLEARVRYLLYHIVLKIGGVNFGESAKYCIGEKNFGESLTEIKQKFDISGGPGVKLW